MLKAEYPRGIDLVFESVGGSMFEAAVNALAKKGRVIIIGTALTACFELLIDE